MTQNLRQPPGSEDDRSPDDTESPADGQRIKSLVFTAVLTTALGLGSYSLLLAVAEAGAVRLSPLANLQRTAAATDVVNIQNALGDQLERDVVFVVVESSGLGLHPEIEIAARKAAETLTGAGVAAGVRLLESGDPDYSTIVEQNHIDRFPSVLVVKKQGGIILVTEELSRENLQHVYGVTWGKASSCLDAATEIY